MGLTLHCVFYVTRFSEVNSGGHSEVAKIVVERAHVTALGGPSQVWQRTGQFFPPAVPSSPTNIKSSRG